jgi:hypothetical protein
MIKKIIFVIISIFFFYLQLKEITLKKIIYKIFNKLKILQSKSIKMHLDRFIADVKLFGMEKKEYLIYHHVDIKLEKIKTEQ